MKILLVYDSQYGNTEEIAKAIARGLGTAAEIKVARVSEVKQSDVTGVDCLIAGSPTQGANATAGIQELIKNLPGNSLKGIKAAAFDTRITNRIIRMFGYAAPKIAKSLEAKGARQVVKPEGFWVKGTRGPLIEGEPERAVKWGEAIATSLK